MNALKQQFIKDIEQFKTDIKNNYIDCKENIFSYGWNKRELQSHFKSITIGKERGERYSLSLSKRDNTLSNTRYELIFLKYYEEGFSTYYSLVVDRAREEEEPQPQVIINLLEQEIVRLKEE